MLQEKGQKISNKMSQTESDEEIECLKEEYSHKIRTDFVNMIKMIESEEEWIHLTEICEVLRQSKEQYHTLK